LLTFAASTLLAATALGVHAFPAVDALVGRALAAYQTPGASIAIVRRGRLAYARGYGTRDAARSLPADATTRYGAGSVTKTIVAALVLRLAERRELSLDDRVTRWFPEVGTWDASWRPLRIRHLLEQTSGSPDYNTAWFLGETAGAWLAARVDREAIVRRLATKRLAFTPGTRFGYSNANYLLLGAIAERAAHVPLAALLRLEIFTPLGMRDTALAAPDPRNAEEAAGYTKTPLGPRPVPPWNPDLTYAAGGVRSTVLDLARFDAALCEGRVLSRSSFATMTSPATLSDGTRSPYGVGFFTYDAGGRRVAWHDGTVLGYRAMHSLLPRSCDAVVVLANADYFHAPVVAMQVERAVFGVPGGDDEPFDAGLPRLSMVFAGAMGLAPLGLAVVLRRRRLLGACGLVASYAAGSVWLPAGACVAAAFTVAVAPWPRTAKRPHRHGPATGQSGIRGLRETLR
jgi:D-alanyl-D-alanine carboxypeptidase